jgi:phosphoribosylaminoimidazolecarboxamide formyltransferase/IMP cyclohydrolase
MRMQKTIRSALISVYDKEGLTPIIHALHQAKVHLYSTGGTQTFIESLGVPVTPVESLTDYPAILGGRVKTLHPKILGGILARPDLASDQQDMNDHGISSIDLVMVDLYPFEATLATAADEAELIEKIDIGGITLIRAAAKNHQHTVIIASPNQYPAFLAHLQTHGPVTDLAHRRQFATQAFHISSHYDSIIFNYFNTDTAIYKMSLTNGWTLRYGENPHQKGQFFGHFDAIFQQLNGKVLSYNNLLDVDAAVHLMAEFQDDGPSFAIIKHNNACGLATRPSLLDAYQAALAADPISAFGGVLIANAPIDLATAEAMHPLFFEILIAPSFEPDALTLLQTKPQRILLRQKNGLPPYPTSTFMPQWSSGARP